MSQSAMMAMANHVILDEEALDALLKKIKETRAESLTDEQLAEKIPGSVWFNTFDEVAEHVVNNAESGDLIITLGCGDIYKAAKIMIKLLKERQ